MEIKERRPDMPMDQQHHAVIGRPTPELAYQDPYAPAVLLIGTGFSLPALFRVLGRLFLPLGVEL